ncbi:uncharacterized protein EKO05_0009349 [Ascochyta rabiei]|uniref:uncharacterized protein n=1 Tax=Didymella rabiei TaxID=5454 RepID=UPI00220CF0D6|nr:uncharacterized protein EKO05_0009349 [Ascochyta rabiei]UPX19073.1 hypothetical protein EKO05_0009349 [Ascochyta rabiei]
MESFRQCHIPTTQSAFVFATRPFSHDHVYYPIDALLFSLTEPESPIESRLTLSLLGASIPRVALTDTAHSEGSQADQHGITNVNARYGPVAVLRRTQTQSMLMCCQMFQATIRNISSKPWSKDGDSTIYEHFQSMRKLAYEAQQLAEGAQSQGLQARCEYWLGCACAGTQDFLAAADHLKRARWLDVPDGLRFEEKADIHFLLACVEKHIEAVVKDDFAVGSDQYCSSQERGMSFANEASLQKWTAPEHSYTKHGLETPRF